MENKIKLYIVKKDDTLNSISKNNNVAISEIIRLNPLAKYNLFEGQPLLLNVLKKEEEKVNLNIVHNDLNSFFYNYKITLLSSIFFEKGFNTYYSIFLNSFNNLHTFTIKSKELLLKLFEKTFIFKSFFNIEKQKELMNLQKEIKEISYNLKAETNNKYVVDILIENIELYILNLYNNDFINAEENYNIFINEFKKLTK